MEGTQITSGDVANLSQNSRAEYQNKGLYIGTKIVKGEPMDERTFLQTVKGKTEEELQKQETQGDGYKVTYEDGYVSWSPKKVFEQCYRLLSNKEIRMAKNVIL